MIDLGFSEGWGETKEIVEICEFLKHTKEIIHVSNCVTQYVCRKCGYFYMHDETYGENDATA